MDITTVGKYLAKRLEEIGIRDYFAIPGDFNLALLDELLTNKTLKMINCCNELNAGYAADGYARSHGVAALVVTFSVGGLSAVNAVAGAYAEDLPIIVISGGPNINSVMKDHVLHHTLGETEGRQEYVRDIFQNITAYTAIIRNIADAPFQIDHAIQIALKKRKPVYIEIACNLAMQSIGSPRPLQFYEKIESDPKSLQAAVEHVADFLNAALKPVLIAGPKIRAFGAKEVFCKLSDQSGYGTACMPNAKGFFPETHPNYIGIYWGSVGSPGCREVVESSDAYLFVGSIMSDYTTVGRTALINPNKCIDASPGRVRIEGQSYHGIELAEFLEKLTPKLKKNIASRVTYEKIEGEAVSQETSLHEAITTRRLFTQIEKILDANTTLLVEMGDSWFNGMRLHLPRGCQFELQMQYGSIGWSVGAFLGLVSAPERRKVVACIGDGSFQMTAQEISTVFRYGYSGIIFLMNNFGYTIEVKIHDGPYNEIQHWQYSKLIDVFKGEQGKGWSCVVKTEEDLLKAIAKAKTFEGLSFIEVMLDREDCNKNLLAWGSEVAAYNSTPPPQ
jgi:indolepyruvate decarboxylase